MRTKYEIGSRLWPLLSMDGKSFVNPPFDCQVIRLVGNEIHYGFTTKYGFPEVNVFPSEAEAQAESARRNGWSWGAAAATAGPAAGRGSEETQ